MRRFVALAPEVASESLTAPSGDVRLLLHVIQQCFVLGIKPDDGPSLLEIVRKLPADLQMLWTETLRSRLARTDLIGLAHGASSTDCRVPMPTAREILQLVAAGPAVTCAKCGSPHEPWPTIAANADVRACLAQSSSNVLTKGTSRESAYADNLRSIARAARNCVIIDRYAGVRLQNRADASGIAWLADRLVGDGVERVILVTSRANSSDTAIAAAAAALASQAVRDALRIEVVPDPKFMANAHDRFILLQAGHAACGFSIGKGVEVFERATVAQESAFSTCDGGAVGRILGRMSVSVAQHFA